MLACLKCNSYTSHRKPARIRLCPDPLLCMLHVEMMLTYEEQQVQLWALEGFIIKPTKISPSPSITFSLPEILLARLLPWITSKTSKHTAYRNLRACFCPAFHLDNNSHSVLKRGQATYRYVRQGNVMHLLMCCKFTQTIRDPSTKLTCPCPMLEEEKNTHKPIHYPAYQLHW